MALRPLPAQLGQRPGLAPGLLGIGRCGAAIGRALRAEFVASGADMLRLEADDGAELIVYAIEVRAIVMAATNIQLINGEAYAQN